MCRDIHTPRGVILSLMTTTTRTVTISDPVGIHARPAATFSQAASTSGCTVTIAKQGGSPVNANSILSIMGLGIKQGDTIAISVEGDNADVVADRLVSTLTQS